MNKNGCRKLSCRPIYVQLSIISLLLIGFFSSSIITSISESKEPEDANISSYTTHGWIAIYSNAEFIAQASSEGWPGSGTDIDPYIIEGYDINNVVDAIIVANTDVHFIIRNCFLHDLTGHAIKLFSVSNAMVFNNTCSQSSLTGDNGLIEIDGSSSNITVEKCICNFASGMYGVFVASSMKIDLINNNCSNFLWGISIFSSNNNMIANNNCSNNSDGIFLKSSSSNTIMNNTCRNKQAGIYLREGSHNNEVFNNTCNSNIQDGIYFNNANSNNITRNNCSSNPNGIRIYSSNNNRVSNNTCRSNSNYGIILQGCPNSNTVDNNTVDFNFVGIRIEGSSYQKVVHNTLAKNTDTAIYIAQGSFNAVSKNYLELNFYGISWWNTLGNEIFNNIIRNSTHYGADAVHTASPPGKNTIWNNTLIGNNGATSTFDLSHIQALDDSTVNDWYVIESPHGYGNYWADWTTPDNNNDGIVDNYYSIDGGSGVKDIYPLTSPPVPTINSIIINSNSELVSKAIIEGWNGNGSSDNPYLIENYWLIASGSPFAISIGNTSLHFMIRDCHFLGYGNEHWTMIHFDNVSNGGIVSNIFVADGGIGVSVNNSYDITVRLNSLSGNMNYGLSGVGCQDFSICNNTITSGIYGIRLEKSDDARIFNNTCSRIINGILLNDSQNANISRNEISNCSQFGLRISNCSGSQVSNNDLMNNTCGLIISSCENLLVSGNIFAKDGILIEGTIISQFSSHYIDPSNLVNGLPIEYYKNVSGTTIDNRTVGQLLLANCSNVYLTNIKIDETAVGMLLAYVNGGTVGRNNLSYCSYSDLMIIASSNLTITGNNIGNSDRYGAFIRDTQNLTIISNNFFDNAIQAVENNGINNSWNGVYPSGGNYWSNEMKTDINHGPGQNILGPDNICDLPLVIDSDSIDHYPLMTPNNNTFPVASFTAAPSSLMIKEILDVNASSSTDIETPNQLQVRWDWDNDGTWDTVWSSDKVAYHNYSEPGIYSIVLEVKDGGGLTTKTIKTISVVNTPPRALFDVHPLWGYTSTWFQFDASNCSDLEDSSNSLQVRWKFENTSSFTDWSYVKIVQHKYEVPRDYWVRLEVIDKNNGTNYSLRQITVNNTPPTAGFTVTPLFGNTTTIFNFNAGQSWDNETVKNDLQVRWDFENDGFWEKGWSDVKTTNHSYVTEGNYTAVLEVMDLQLKSTKFSYNVTIDNHPPVTSLAVSGQKGGEFGWYNGSVRIYLNASDQLSGVYCILYKIDNVSKEVRSPKTSVMITDDGNHSIEYHSVDLANNIESVQYLLFNIDMTCPTTCCILSGTMGLNDWYISPVNVNLTAFGDTSGINFTKYRIDEETNWHNYSEFIITANGEHTVIYYSQDKAKNTEIMKTISFRIDKTRPVTNWSIIGTSGTNGWYKSQALISLNGEDNDSDIDCTWYQINNSSPLRYLGQPIRIYEDGKYTLDFWSVDKAGNIEVIKSIPIWIDASTPRTSEFLDVSLNANGWTSNPTVNLTLTASEGDTGSGIAMIFYSLDGGQITTYSHKIMIAVDMMHTLEFYSVDNAGNRENNHTLLIGIDSTAPTHLIIQLPPQIESGQAFTAYLKASDATSRIDHFKYSLDGINWYETWNDYINFTNPTEGSHQLLVIAYDKAGNPSAQASIIFGVGPGGILGVLTGHYTEIMGVALGIVLTIAADKILERARHTKKQKKTSESLKNSKTKAKKAKVQRRVKASPKSPIPPPPPET